MVAYDRDLNYCPDVCTDWVVVAEGPPHHHAYVAPALARRGSHLQRCSICVGVLLDTLPPFDA